jgi:uncharacterized membrane protein YfcA
MPLLWLSLSFVCGILLGWWLHWPRNAWLGLAGLAILLYVVYKMVKRLPALRRPRPASGPVTRSWWAVALPYPVLAAALCLGAARLQATRLDLGPG